MVLVGGRAALLGIARACGEAASCYCCFGHELRRVGGRRRRSASVAGSAAGAVGRGGEGAPPGRAPLRVRVLPQVRSEAEWRNKMMTSGVHSLAREEETGSFFELKRAVEAGMKCEVHLIVFSEVTAVQLNDFQLFYSPPLTSVYLQLIVDNYFF